MRAAWEQGLLPGVRGEGKGGTRVEGQGEEGAPQAPPSRRAFFEATMSKTKIEWTDNSWNVVTGCTKISPGCKHCYAETFAERWRGTPGHPYEQGFDLKLWPDRVRLPLLWKKPRRIFVNSMSDLFHESIPLEFIKSVFAVMTK